ncbi:MAG: NADH-quinone oxidoreductase subunit J [Verrucomicrobia bacterium]|nr:MAG: NADH-quinone oxidoreductase subunit J [Verrucomicrobiota bacterium]
MDPLGDLILARFNYWIYVVLMMIGLYAMITKNNLIKKLIGMSIFQTAIILFFVSTGVKEGATIPIIDHGEDHGSELVEAPAAAEHVPEGRGFDHEEALESDAFANPLPHVLMLTAIVVGVATLGVGLSVVQKVFIRFQTLEEDQILENIRTSDG